MEIISSHFQTVSEAVKAGIWWAKGHLVVFALISLGVAAPLWLLEHDARLRREFDLRQLQRQAAAEIANLRARAAAALEDADASAQRIRDLETRRHQLERAEANLKSQISDLKTKERARLQETASLPFPAIRARLQEQLGPEALAARDSRLGAGDSGFGVRDSGDAENRNSNIENRDSSLDSSGLQGTRAPLPGAPAGGASRGGNSIFQIQDSGSSKLERPRTNPASRSPDLAWQEPSPESPIPNPELVLTEHGARTIAAALVERDACREQAQLKDGMLANCQEQTAASRAVIEELQRSVVSLKEAVRLKDEIESRSDAVHRAELKAARGSRLRRFGRALQYVGAGVVVGVVIAR